MCLGDLVAKDDVVGLDATRSGCGLLDANLSRAREAGFAVVACRSCENSNGNVAGVGGSRRGVVSCDFLLTTENDNENFYHFPRTRQTNIQSNRKKQTCFPSSLLQHTRQRLLRTSPA